MVNVSIKVIDVNTPDTVSDLSHQDVFIAFLEYAYGMIRCINIWKKCDSYNLTNFTVREFCYLNISKSGADIAPITDLGTVADATPKEEKTTTIKNVLIAEISVLDIYNACLQCKAHVEPCTPLFVNGQGKTTIRDEPEQALNT